MKTQQQRMIQLSNRELQIASERTQPTSAQAQHSPLPWKAGKSYHVSNPAILCPHNEMIAQIYTLANHKCTKGKDDANIRFIVRACNNAQRLADALHDLMCDSRNHGKAQEALAQWEKAQ